MSKGASGWAILDLLKDGRLFRNVLGLDLRAMALFRFGMGTLLIIDLVTRYSDLRGHYTDFGILPVAPYVELFANQLHVSLHLANGGWGWILFLMAIHLVAAFCVAVGYRTRLATFVAWFLLVSLHNRNTYILNGGDVLFRCLYFFAMFLPLQARWSVDAALSPKKPSPDSNQFFGGPTIALTLQICFVYLTTALLKSGKEWWPDGTASYYALSLDEFTTPFGKWMLQWYDLLHYSTFAVYAFEWAVAFMILSPIFRVPLRILAVLGLWVLHLNFDLTMRLGIFPWVDIVGVSVLIPGAVFDWVGRRLEARHPRRDFKIFYDQGCGFCRKAVLILTEFLLIPKACIHKAEEDKTVQKIMTDEHSWVVEDEGGKHFRRWDAMLVLLRQSPLAIAFGSRRLPLEILRAPANLLYRLIVSSRKSLGSFTARFLPERDVSNVETSTLVNLLTLFFIGYVGLWNMKSVPRFGVDILPPWNKIGSILRLDQKWNMFAPYPLRMDGWYVMDGELRNGTKVDVLRGTEGQVSYDKPEVVSYMFKNARWRKFIMSLYEKTKKNHRLYYGKYLCRSWNEDRDEDQKLMKFQIYFMKEKNVLPGVESKVEKTMIWQHDCFKKKAEDAPDGKDPEPSPAAKPEEAKAKAPDATPEAAPDATPEPEPTP